MAGLLEEADLAPPAEVVRELGMPARAAARALATGFTARVSAAA
jgi:hypothetical protein